MAAKPPTATPAAIGLDELASRAEALVERVEALKERL
jgi:hypothetical protein